MSRRDCFGYALLRRRTRILFFLDGFSNRAVSNSLLTSRQRPFDRTVAPVVARFDQAVLSPRFVCLRPRFSSTFSVVLRWESACNRGFTSGLASGRIGLDAVRRICCGACGSSSPGYNCRFQRHTTAVVRAYVSRSQTIVSFVTLGSRISIRRICCVVFSVLGCLPCPRAFQIPPLSWSLSSSAVSSVRA